MKNNNSVSNAAGEAAHTPVIEIYTHVLGASVIERTGHHSKVIQDFRSLEEANAFVLGHRIACNAYDSDQRKIKALVEALENFLGCYENDDWSAKPAEIARAALALAKEGQ